MELEAAPPAQLNSVKTRLLARFTRRANALTLDSDAGAGRPKSTGPILTKSLPLRTDHLGNSRSSRGKQRLASPMLTERTASPTVSSPELAAAQFAARSITVHTIQSIRKAKPPTESELKLSGAFLALLCEVEPRIETLAGRKVPVSSCWDTLLGYTQNPGHVTWVIRRLPTLMLQGKVSVGKLHLATCKRVQGMLAGLQFTDLPEKSTLTPLLSFLRACLSLLLPSPVSPPPVPVPRSTKSPLLRKAPVVTDNPPKEDSKSEAAFSDLFSPLWLNVGFNSHSTIPDFQTVRDLHWRLEDAFKLYLREKLMAQSDVKEFVEENRAEILEEFAVAAQTATKDFPESLRLYAIQPFLEKLNRNSLLEDITKTVTSLVPP